MSNHSEKNGVIENGHPDFDSIYWEGNAFSWDQKQPGIHYLTYELTGSAASRERFDLYIDHAKTGKKTPAGFRWYVQWGSVRTNANTHFLILIDAVRNGDTDSQGF